jgi:protein-S-isoprenylcysteine O-methyltransferase Ste14
MPFTFHVATVSVMKRMLWYERRLRMAWRIASVLAFLGVAFSAIALFFVGGLLSPNPWTWVGQGLALALMLWARISFGLRSFHAAANPTQGGLVTHGPYAYLRHPIYAAILLFLWSGVAAHLTPLPIALALAATVCTGVRIAAEERLLVAMYPEYTEYAERVRRLIPGVF